MPCGFHAEPPAFAAFTRRVRSAIITRSDRGFTAAPPRPRKNEGGAFMAMSTGAKVAIGCGIAVLAAGGVVVIGLGVGAYWLKGKVEKSGADFTALTTEIGKHRRQADASHVTAPAER